MAYLSKEQVYKIKKSNDLKLMKNYCDEDKTNGFIHLEYARMLIHNKMYIEAKEELKPLLGTKYNAAVRYEFGKIAFALKNYDLAREHFKYVEENTYYAPERDKARYALARLEFDCKNLDASKKYFEELLETSFDEVSRLNLGRINYEDKNFEEAKELLKGLLDSNYSSPAKYELAKTEYALGNIDVARYYFQSLVNEGNTKALYKLGELEFNEGNFKDAEEYFEKINYTGLYLPKTKYMLGKKEEAINGFKSLLNSKDSRYSAIFLSIILIKEGRNEEAFDVIKNYMSSYDMVNDGIKLKIALTLFKELGVFFYKEYPRMTDLPYTDRQIINYDETRALSHININHVNREGKNNFKNDIDLYSLLTEVKEKLIDDIKAPTLNLNDMYHLDYPNIGKQGESLLRVITTAGTKDIITMFPVFSKRDNVVENEEESIDYDSRVDMLLNKISTLYQLSKTNDFEFSDAFSDSEKQLIIELFDIKTKRLSK